MSCASVCGEEEGLEWLLLVVVLVVERSPLVPAPAATAVAATALSDRVRDKPVKVQLCGKEMVLFRCGA